MEDGINFFFPDGSNIIGRIEITDIEMIIYKKSNWTFIFFGLIGQFISNLISKGKEVFRIRIDDIAEAGKRKFGLNKNAYRLRSGNGDEYILILSHPRRMIPYLDSVFASIKERCSIQE